MPSKANRYTNIQMREHMYTSLETGHVSAYGQYTPGFENKHSYKYVATYNYVYSNEIITNIAIF